MSYRLLLAEALKKTQSRNPLFSLRAMARQLALSPAHLSQVMSGKRPITLRVAFKIAEKLEMAQADREALLKLAVRTSKSVSGLSSLEFQTLTQPEFEPISEWYYFAILSLGHLKTNRASAKWISEQLGISFAEAKEAYEKLRALGYIEVRDGKFRQSTKPLHSARDVPSAAVRKYHKQNLDLARDRMDAVSVDKKDYNSMTMAVSAKKLARAKKMIHAFKLRLYRYLQSEEADDVYTLAIQLFPLTNNIKGRGKTT